MNLISIHWRLCITKVFSNSSPKGYWLSYDASGISTSFSGTHHHILYYKCCDFLCRHCHEEERLDLIPIIGSQWYKWIHQNSVDFFDFFSIILPILHSLFFTLHAHVSRYRNQIEIPRILSKTKSCYRPFITAPSREWSDNTFYRFRDATDAGIPSLRTSSTRNSYRWFSEVFQSGRYRWGWG